MLQALCKTNSSSPYPSGPPPSLRYHLPSVALPALLAARGECSRPLPPEQTATGGEEAPPLGSNLQLGAACSNSHSRTPTVAVRNTFNRM